MIKESLKFIIYGQCVPRIIRIYPLYKAVTRTSGLLLEKAWAGAAFNLLLFMFASHVSFYFKFSSFVFWTFFSQLNLCWNRLCYFWNYQVFGTFWYLFSIDRKVRCWEAVCRRPDCDSSYLYCSTAQKQNYTFLDTACPLIEPNDIKDSKEFSFGIFIDALRSGVVESKDLSKKLFYCSWWGLRNLRYVYHNRIPLWLRGLASKVTFAAALWVKTYKQAPLWGRLSLLSA